MLFTTKMPNSISNFNRSLNTLNKMKKNYIYYYYKDLDKIEF